MNKIYKVIWNAASGTWTAVSEIGKSKTKTKSSKLAPVAIAVAATLASGVASAAYEQTDANTIAILGDKAALNETVVTGDKKGIYIGNELTAGVASTQGNDQNGNARNSGGASSVMIGTNATNTESNSVIIGSDLYSGTESGVTVAWDGNGGVNNIGNVLIGHNSSAKTAGSVVIGVNAEATDNAGVAIGYNAVAVGQDDVAIGYFASADSGKTPAAQSSTAIGSKSNASGHSSTAIGVQAESSGALSSAFGANSTATAQSATAVGVSSDATGRDSSAFGYNATATGQNSLASGADSKALAGNTVAVGQNTTAAAADATALGVDSNASGRNSSALGARNTVTERNSSAVGNANTIQGTEGGLAINNANAFGSGNIITGGNSALAVGTSNEVNGHRSNVIGNNNNVTGWESTALGNNNTVQGQSSYVMGNNNTVTNSDVVAIGTNIVNPHRNSVILGANSSAVGSSAAENTTIDIGGENSPKAGYTYDASKYAGYESSQQVGNYVSVGSEGNERQFKFVAAGNVSANSTDVINGSQLFAVMERLEQVAQNGWNIGENGKAGEQSENATRIGLDDKVNFNNGNLTVAKVETSIADNRYIANVTYDVVTQALKTDATDGKAAVSDSPATANGNPVGEAANPNALTTAQNVADAINNSGFIVTNTDGTTAVVNPGDKVNFVDGKGTIANVVTAGDTTTVSYDANVDGSTIKVGNDGKLVGVALENGSNTVVNTRIGANGETIYSIDTKNDISDITSIAINGKDGADGTNGANAVLTVAQGPKGVDGKDGAAGADGKARIVYTQVDAEGKPVVDADGNPVTEQVATLNDGLKFVGNDGQEIVKKLNETLAIKGTADLANPDPSLRPVLSEGNIGVVTKKDAEGNDYLAVELVKDVDLGADGSLNAGTITIPAEQGTATTKLTTKAGVPVATDGVTGEAKTVNALSVNGNQITDVANGQINATSTDAINGAQLYSVIEKVGDKVADVTAGSNNLQVTTTVDPVTGDKVATIDLAPVVTIGKDAPVTIDGNNGTIGGLTNKTFDPANPVSGQAATEDQLAQVANAANATSETVAKGLNFAGNQGDVINKQLGEQVDVIGGLANDAKASDINTRVDSENGKLIVKIAEDAKFTTVTATDKVSIGENGPSISKDGIDAAGKVISNVGNGTQDGDAVNVKQLKEFQAQVAQDLANATKPTISVDKDANATNSNATEDGVAKDGKDGANGADGKDGDIKFVAGDNVTIIKDGSDITIGVSKNPEFETVKVGGKGADGKDGVDGKITVSDKAGNPGVTVSATDGVGTIGLNGKDGANANISVEKGPAGVDGKDAGKDRLVYTGTDANGNPIKETVATLNDGIRFTDDKGNAIDTKLNGGIAINGNAGDKELTDGNIGVVAENGALVVKLAKDVDLGANGSVKAGTVTVAGKDGSSAALTAEKGQAYNTDGTANGANTVNVLNVGTAANPTRVSGVANGAISATSTDAINGSQLYNVANTFNNNLNNTANALNGRINDVEDKAEAGTAAALAAAGLPQVYLPGKNLVAVAASTYEGKTGYAVGFSSISDGGNWILKGTATGNSESKFGGTVGLGYQW
ncbi:ESPR-type extended signal peptide-containing protein [Moraxella sp.]|uniref:ESPR-type extended signal peptide-containing protein n=1 Tax=Moraxella sp. TaxID=479 RepID=UPI0026DD8AFD|nr:ESPR-type extended signal peptide-containing protein [Moraxella sp.]MDO4895420.1 ESPR-type extended signal peptide-containing protein [Moraxella sp.]